MAPSEILIKDSQSRNVEIPASAKTKIHSIQLYALVVFFGVTLPS